MRIIDKNTDFYDYLQYLLKDDTFTFDRTNSFILTKEIMCDYLWTHREVWVGEHHFVLMQVCNTFWLFDVEITKTVEDDRGVVLPDDYSVDLLACWKHYYRLRQLFSMNIIRFNMEIFPLWRLKLKKRPKETLKMAIIERIPVFMDAINNDNYEIVKTIADHPVRISGGKYVKKHLPILIASGFPSVIDPKVIYLALEEYFSLEAASYERTESIGLTDKERIENHGFDAKTSFRGRISH